MKLQPAGEGPATADDTSEVTLWRRTTVEADYVEPSGAMAERSWIAGMAISLAWFPGVSAARSSQQ